MTTQAILQELAVHIEKHAIINPKISTKSVAWQIDHILKVVIAVCKTISTSNPKEYKWRFNLNRIIILSTGYIPRGQARAPKAVVATDEIDINQLKMNLEEAQNLLTKLETLNQDHFFKHPYFGEIKVKTTKRFLEVHSFHHLKIIRDILR